MSQIDVAIKHAGKTINLVLDTSQPSLVFKQAIYEQTGVPVERMKVMTKGVVLKEDTQWSKLALKSGHIFTVIGATGELPKPPEQPVVFLEDLTDGDASSSLRLPVGLVNLGNTCYMNSTLQCLRTIPELEIALRRFTATPQSGPNGMLTTELRRLYEAMSQTTDKMIPAIFLQKLRVVAPQFAEQRPGQGYAQQDAEECLGSILTAMRDSHLKVHTSDDSPPAELVEKYIMGEMTTEHLCDEAPEETSTVSVSAFLKLDCNINITTNYMQTGIKESLDQKIEKHSPTLGRTATYSQKSRISRLPSNLIVHMVRFWWRQDINKKAKIMRKVKFPFELDVLDFVTEDLKRKLLPVNARLKEIENDRHERRKVRKRTRKINTSSSVVVPSAPAPPVSPTVTVGGNEAPEGVERMSETIHDTVMSSDADADERDIRARETSELEALIDPELRADIGSNVTGIYELVGMITHKGASADSGHYIAFARADVLDSRDELNPDYDRDMDQWVRFDDDKVSPIPAEKVAALDGGGEDSAAYILLYRSKKAI
ncbi:deubiquitinating enzyme [Serendipita sp. 400]|nr:deubiquitinating enzyme [Serendipita sp. 400]